MDIAGHLDPDKAAAEDIGHHYLILDSLFRRLLIDAVKAGDSSGRSGSEAAERLLNAAFKAHRASLSCLNALKVLREATPPTTSTPIALSGEVQLIPDQTSDTP